MPSATLLSLQNISVARDKRPVLHDVNMHIDRGDFVSVVGPNGAGKSTLLHCILGLSRPQAGKVTVRPGLTFGYTPQSLAFDPVFPLTVKRLLTMRPQKAHHPDHEKRILNWMAVKPLLDKKIGEISGGERQRVLLTRALLSAPDLLILDEPEQNLDIEWQNQLHALLSALHEDAGLTVILVSHHIRLVMACSTKVVCLYHHVCCQGTPQQISRDRAFRELFGAHLAPYAHQQGGCRHSHDPH